MKFPASIFLAFLCASSLAQDFKPYPRAGITVDQWQAYFDEVQRKHGGDAQDIDAEKLLVFFDKATFTSYAFTKPGNAAHPAWISRQVRDRDGKVSVAQIGYFAGKEEDFAKLFRAYQQLNDRMRENISNRNLAPATPSAASTPQ